MAQNKPPRLIRMEYLMVTPDLARKMLENSLVNRPIRWKKVHLYADEMKRGKWIEGIGEPISRNEAGALHNGRHRLNGVIEANCIIGFYVQTWEGTETTAMKTPYDRGLPRTGADIIEQSKRNTAAVKTMGRILYHVNDIPDDVLKKFYDKFSEHINAVAGDNIKVYNVAPVRAAVVLRHACGVDWSGQHSALIHGEFNGEMHPSTQLLYHRLQDVKGLHGTDQETRKFAFTWFASDTTRQQSRMFPTRKTWEEEAIGEARTNFQHFAPELDKILTRYQKFDNKRPFLEGEA